MYFMFYTTTTFIKISILLVFSRMTHHGDLVKDEMRLSVAQLHLLLLEAEFKTRTCNFS